MEGSGSEHSYARYSDFQNITFHTVGKPWLSEAIDHLLCKSASDAEAYTGGSAAIAKPPRHKFAVADLGCAYGRNTLDCAEFVVRKLLENLGSGDEEASCHDVVDIQYFFSDLPSNDFNALFKSLTPYLYQSDSGGADTLPKLFAAGVPGSFYGRLFPSASLDLVICSYALHWLSEVPPSLVDKMSPAWNGGKTWISRTKPSKAVADAYARQSQIDRKRFLRSRAEELIPGGILFLLWVARSSECEYIPKEQSVSTHDGSIPLEYAQEHLDYAWKAMVDEGIIALEEMDMFNMMLYLFNQQELEASLQDVPEFRVLHMESIEGMPVLVEQKDPRQMVEQWIGLQASTAKPAVEAHVGKCRADELFNKLKTICLNQYCCAHPRLTHTIVVATLQRV